jgi:3-hydroxyacyl-[acyl-carrier-protein] dehydratase
MKKQKNLEIPTNHPAFAGHFPCTPIVPGVVLLDEAIQVITADIGLAATAWQISTVKFLSPLKPGESVIIEYEQHDNSTVKFEVLDGSRQIVIGSMALRILESAT